MAEQILVSNTPSDCVGLEDISYNTFMGISSSTVQSQRVQLCIVCGPFQL